MRTFFELGNNQVQVQVQVQGFIEHKQYMFVAHTSWAVADIQYTYNNI